MTLPKVSPIVSVLTPTPEGDGRGRYGYGRPAHGSDPRAAYAFEPKDLVVPLQATDPAAIAPAAAVVDSASLFEPDAFTGEMIDPERIR